MSKFKLSKVTAVPQALDPSTIYIVRRSESAPVEMYFSNKEGTQVFAGITEEYVTDKIAEYADNGFQSVEVVADIAARDALNLIRNTFVMVLDATADVTVETGSALYLFRKSDNSFHKVAEYDAIDLATTWDRVQGRPSSTPAEIDGAVNGYLTLGRLGLDEEGNITVDGSIAANVAITVKEW